MRIVTFERPEPREARDGGQGALGAAALGFEALGSVRHGAERLGAIVPEGPLAGATIDLNRALAVQLAMEDAGAPEAQADSLLPAETDRFMRRFSTAIEAARASLTFVLRHAAAYDAPDWETAGVLVPARELRARAPVSRGAGVLEAESDEAGPFRLRPLAAATLAGPGDETRLSPQLEVCAQGALAVVISRDASRIQARDAAQYVAGYCPALAYQGTRLRGEPLDPALGRSCDGFTVLGPSLVTAEEIPEPADLLVRTRCSGALVGDSRSKREAGFLGELLAQATELLTLAAGDLLVLPLPGHRTRTLRDGDVVELEIERVGRVVRFVRSRAA